MKIIEYAVMRTLVLLFLSLVSSAAHAQTFYYDLVRIDFADHTDFYAGCWVVDSTFTRIGAYCTDRETVIGSTPSVARASEPEADILIFSFDASFSFVDETGACVVTQIDPHEGYTFFRAQCGDFIFRDTDSAAFGGTLRRTE